MRLDTVDALSRLAAHDHGILGTVHAERGVDLVPCVFALDDDVVGVPVDRVKPKASARLRRERNLEADPRATLLVEAWEPHDWSRLWWVRTELRWEGAPEPRQTDALADLLVANYPQYRARPFDRILVLRVVGVSGWSGSG